MDSRTNTPHVRCQAHREFVIPRGSPFLPILGTSTDVRTFKVNHVMGNPQVDIAWWLQGTAEQYRISGRAYLVPAPEHALHAECMARVAKSPALSLVDKKGADGEDETDFSWEKRRTEAFAEMRPALKASCRIVEQPGSVIESYDALKKYPRFIPNLDQADSDEQKENWKLAFANFALMYIEPTQVEYMELPARRRTLYTRQDDAGYAWKEELLVP